MAPNEKLPLLRDASPGAPPPRRSGWPRLWAALAALALLRLCWTMSVLNAFLPRPRPHHPDFTQQCRQVGPLFPAQKSAALDRMDAYLASPQFLNASVPRLAGAVQIPTQSYDDMGAVGEDARWDVMYDLAEYLERTFPLVFGSLLLEKVNTHGLLFTWEGSDPSLKPTVLMAHQDVVPVELSTVEQWTYPPWSGEYDGRFLWGRGAGDCKNILIGILEAVELLLDAGFTPKRTVVLSFGFDEEISGYEGAGPLAEVILDRYGKDGAAIIVDEGSGLSKQWGTLFAMPAVAEKGYIDVDVIVRMPGGHSSVPPKHNGIGVMAELIAQIEANTYEPHLHDENPTLGLLQCGAAFSPEFPPRLRRELRHRRVGDAEVCRKEDRVALEAAKISDYVKYMFTTSVAADLISGGAKINALPERTVLTVNHRVNVGDRTSDVEAHLTRLAAQVAKKSNLTLHAFPEDGGETPSSITLKIAFHSSLEPAPVSPFSYDGETSAWSVLSGTTRALYGEELIMAPALSTGNTGMDYLDTFFRNSGAHNADYEQTPSSTGI